MIVSCQIMFSVSECSKTIEMKMFCREWDDLADPYFTHRTSESEYFHYRQNWWISLDKSGNTTEPLRKRSDFNQALPCTPRSWRKTTQAHDLLEVPAMETGIWSGILKKSKKVNRRGCMQKFTIEWGNPLFTDLWRKPKTKRFHEFLLFFCCR